MSDMQVPKAVPTRDELRKRLLGNVSDRFKKTTIKLFGEELELRQPALREIMHGKELDGKDAIVDLIITHAFVPGTDTLVFEEGDRETLLNYPFGTDWNDMVREMNKLCGVNVEAAAKNSPAKA